MSANEAATWLVILGIPVVIARLIVGFSYERRSHKVWTFGLPTVALLVFFVGSAANRTLERSFDTETMAWSLAVRLALLVATQAIATVYAWWPEAPAHDTRTVRAP